MEKEIKKELLAKYNAGLANADDRKRIEELLESGEIDLEQLEGLSILQMQVGAIETEAPSQRLDDQFHAMLAQEKRKHHGKGFSFSFHWSNLFPRLAVAASFLIVGFAGGYFLKGSSQEKSVDELTQQVSELKEMMMLAMLEKESATERLKAVSLTSDMQLVSKKVTAALFQTLNGDENVNVRLAALDVLMNYAKDDEVREELIRSISLQDSPLVQIALADLMVMLQEKKSVSELKKLLQKENTAKEVKAKIEKSLNVLI